MPVNFAQIHSSTNSFSGGTTLINTAFTGNVLAVECTTKPQYSGTEQIVGYLYQFLGSRQVAYALKSGRDLIRLEMNETSRLMFMPTRYLLDNYTLTLSVATVGNIIDGSNSVIVPEELLVLPSRIAMIAVWQLEASSNISNLLATALTLQNQVVALQACCNGTTPTPTPTPTPPGFALRINCGGNQFTDTNGNLWLADQYFSGGQTYDYAALNIPPVLTPPTLNYLQQLFAQERSGNFNYQIPCENGDYTVNLYFCEVGVDSPNVRVFHISLNGTRVTSHFDIFSEVGKGLGMKKNFGSVVVNGLMLIDFSRLADNPQINGIEIIKAS